MELGAAALIGMGLCAAGFAGAAVGIGFIFAQTIETVGRQPNAEARIAKYCWIGFALVEAIALYGLVLAFIMMGKLFCLRLMDENQCFYLTQPYFK